MVKYPIGQQDFRGIREGGYLYVDKTAYIEKLVSRNKYYFLSRPRRFGKSLLLSTLECYFKGERDLFKGLAIESYEEEWQEYPVIRIDFGSSNYGDPRNLDIRLNAILTGYEKKYEVVREEVDDYFTRFENVIKTAFEKSGLPAVVLVDEYEKPLADLIEDKENWEICRGILQGFYSVLKSCDAILKFVFLTGVTKFGQMSVFSGLNNLKDISFNDEYSSICGITEEELVANFGEGIEKLSVKNKTDFKGVIKLLKENYDGYHFSKRSPDIFNPFSVVNALADSEIGSYWASTGTPSLLARVLLKSNFDIMEFDGICVSERRLSEIGSVFGDPVSLFYQTGYLTIKEYDEDANLYILGYPNREVEQAFFNYLLPYYYSREISVDSLSDKLKLAVNRGEPEEMMRALEMLSSGISYEVIPKGSLEKHFQNMMYLVFSLLVSNNVKVTTEHRTSDGRMDILIETPKFIYIMELKRDSLADNALKQIKEKKYALQFDSGLRQIYLIGVNFSSQKRCINGYAIEKL